MPKEEIERLIANSTDRPAIKEQQTSSKQEAHQSWEAELHAKNALMRQELNSLKNMFKPDVDEYSGPIDGPSLRLMIASGHDPLFESLVKRMYPRVWEIYQRQKFIKENAPPILAFHFYDDSSRMVVSYDLRDKKFQISKQVYTRTAYHSADETRYSRTKSWHRHADFKVVNVDFDGALRILKQALADGVARRRQTWIGKLAKLTGLFCLAASIVISEPVTGPNASLAQNYNDHHPTIEV